jgi:thioredoxin-related protein
LRRTVLLAVVCILLVQKAFASPWVTSLATAQKNAKDHNQLIFVDLFADWCGWCHRLEQEVFPSQAFQNATNKKVLLRLNTEDGADGTKLSQRYAISSLPTSLLLTPDLMIAGMVRGYAPPNEFVKQMNEVEGKYGDFLKRVAGESSFGRDYQKRLDLAIEFRARNGLPQSEKRLKKLLSESAVPSTIRDQAYYELAFTQMVGKKFDESLKTIRQFGTVQSKGEAYERARVLTGEIYMQQGNYRGAVDEFRTFKTAFPNSPLVRNIDIVLPQLEKQISGRTQ